MKTYFGTCTTNADVATKIVELQNGETGVTFNENFLLSVYFHANNTINNELKLNLRYKNNQNNINSAPITIRNTLNNVAVGSSNQDGSGDLTSWPSGTIVTFVYTQGDFYITNYKPINNLTSLLNNYISKTNTNIDFWQYAIDNGLLQYTDQMVMVKAARTDALNDDVNSFLLVNSSNCKIYHQNLKTLIPYIKNQLTARVGRNAEWQNLTGKWFLVAEIKLPDFNITNNYTPWENFGEVYNRVDNDTYWPKTANKDYEITFNVRSRMSSYFFGKLRARIRTTSLLSLQNAYQGDTPKSWPEEGNNKFYTEQSISSANYTLLWDYISEEVNPRNFVLITNANSEKYSPIRARNDIGNNTENCTIQIWCKATTQWVPYLFSVEEQGMRTDKYANIWTLSDTWGNVEGFVTPERGFKKTVFDNEELEFSLTAITSQLARIQLGRNSAIRLTDVDFFKPDNGKIDYNWSDGPTYYPIFSFKDLNGWSYARFETAVNGSPEDNDVNRPYYTAASLIALNIAPSTNDPNVLAEKSRSQILLEAYKNGKSLIKLLSTMLKIDTGNIKATINTNENHLELIGTKATAYLWADNNGNNNTAEFNYGAGMWYKTNSTARRIIDFQIKNPNDTGQGGNIYLGQAGDAIYLNGNTWLQSELFRKSRSADFTQNNNNIDSNGIGLWPGFRFYDNSHTSIDYARFMAPFHSNGAVGITLQSVNYTSQLEKLSNSEVTIALYSYKNNTGAIGIDSDNFRVSAHKNNTNTILCANHSRNADNRSQIFLWANDSTHPTFPNQLGLSFGRTSNSGTTTFPIIIANSNNEVSFSGNADTATTARYLYDASPRATAPYLTASYKDIAQPTPWLCMWTSDDYDGTEGNRIGAVLSTDFKNKLIFSSSWGRDGQLVGTTIPVDESRTTCAWKGRNITCIIQDNGIGITSYNSTSQQWNNVWTLSITPQGKLKLTQGDPNGETLYEKTFTPDP